MLASSACREDGRTATRQSSEAEFAPRVCAAHAMTSGAAVLSADSLAAVTSIAPHPSGRGLAVLDVTTGLVADFAAPAWGPPRYIGGKGSAPGRFQCPSSIRLLGDQVWVADNCRGQFVALSQEGVELSRLEPPLGGASLVPFGRFAWRGDTLLFSQSHSALKDVEGSDGLRRARDQLVAWVPSSRTPPHVLAEAASKWANINAAGPPHLMPLPFAPRLLWDVSPVDGLVAVARDSAFRIELLDVRGHRRSALTLPIRGPRVREADRAATRRSYASDLRLTPGQVHRLRFPARKAAIRSLRFDPSGSLWVWVLDESDRIPSADSAIVLRWHPGAGEAQRFLMPCFPLAFVSPREIACREEDSLGEQRVRLFTVAIQRPDSCPCTACGSGAPGP